MAVTRYPRNTPAASTRSSRLRTRPVYAGRPITKIYPQPVLRPGNKLGIPERLPSAWQPGAAAAGAGVPGAAGAASAAAAAPPDNPDKSLDSTYFAGVAGLQFQNKNSISDLKLQQGYADTDYQTTLRRMAEQQAQATQNNRQSMNKKGLFYSGQLGKRQGEIDKGYEEQNYDITKNYTRGSDARSEAIKRIQLGEPLQIQELRGQADQRYLSNLDYPESERPGLGGLAPQGLLPDGRIITAHKPGSSAPSITYDPKLGGEWHRYENGKTVFVKRKKK